MRSTAEWLDEVKARHNLTSDYQLAQLLEADRQQVSQWKNGHHTMSDYAALRVAEALKVNPMEVIASVNAERAKRTEERRAWEALAKKAAAAAMCLIVGAISWLYPTKEGEAKQTAVASSTERAITH